MPVCTACGKPLTSAQLCEYIRCGRCGTYTYVSDRDAEEENNAYFNEIFSIIDDCREDGAKRQVLESCRAEDRRMREKEYKKFEETQKQILATAMQSRRLLEIGFGSGGQLHSFLESGVDAYGVDISTTAVSNFQRKYPQYEKRVNVRPDFGKEFECVYCCALFEHLDDPGGLLADISSRLVKNGVLIVDALPILNKKKADIAPLYDINFWKPCHRTLYSVKGLKMLMSRCGYALKGYGTIDDFNYRVLSLHLQGGYDKVAYLRNACLEDQTLPDLHRFTSICRQALCTNSSAHFGTFMFKKS